MAAVTSSTLRSHAKGLARRHVSFALFLGVAALPLLTMGVTVPSAVAKSRAESTRTEMRARLAEREKLNASLAKYQDDLRLESLRELHEELVGMIPAAIGPLTEFGELRSAADSLGIVLETVRPMRTHSVGDEGGPGGVLVDEVLVTLRGTVNKVFGLVSEVRKRGLPVIVLSFDLVREMPQQRSFQAELRLGFARRTAPDLPSVPSVR